MVNDEPGIGIAQKVETQTNDEASAYITYTRSLNHLLLRLKSHRALTPIHHRRRQRDRSPPLFPNPEDRTGRPRNGRPR